MTVEFTPEETHAKALANWTLSAAILAYLQQMHPGAAPAIIEAALKTVRQHRRVLDTPVVQRAAERLDTLSLQFVSAHVEHQRRAQKE
jgi:hypothetical protein